MLLVKDLAQLSGLSVYTVEFYLKKGLLKESGRGPFTHYRYFNDQAVQRLKQIRELRMQGMNLADIRSQLK